MQNRIWADYRAERNLSWNVVGDCCANLLDG